MRKITNRYHIVTFNILGVAVRGVANIWVMEKTMERDRYAPPSAVRMTPLRSQRLNNIMGIVRGIAGSAAAVLTLVSVSYFVGNIVMHRECRCDTVPCDTPPICSESTLLMGFLLTATTLILLTLSAGVYVFYFWTYAIATISNSVRHDVEIGARQGVREEGEEEICVLDRSIPLGKWCHIANKRDVVRLRFVFATSYLTGLLFILVGWFATAAAWLALAPILIDLADVYMSPEAKKPRELSK